MLTEQDDEIFSSPSWGKNNNEMNRNFDDTYVNRIVPWIEIAKEK